MSRDEVSDFIDDGRMPLGLKTTIYKPADPALSCLVLNRIGDGGYLVTMPGWEGESPKFLFASTTIEEALEYVSDRLSPEPIVKEA